MTAKLKASVVAMATILCGTAVAETSFTPRWYVGLGGGISKLDPETEDTSYDVVDDGSSGGAIYLGYDVSPWVSLEGHYADLGSASMANTGSTTEVGTIDYQVGGISALFYLFNSQGPEGRAFREGVSLFARVGIGAMDNSATIPFERENDMHLGLGLGLEAYLGKGFSARLAYDAYDEDAKYGSLGVVKRFGTARQVVAAPPPPPEPKPEPVVVVEPVIERVVMDSDGDGVTDDLDACPGTRPGESVDVRGCVFAGVLEGVTFQTNSDRLTREAKVVLDGVIQEMLRYPDVKVEIGAHTDNRGSDQYNLRLSERRAASVLNYLATNQVGRSRLVSRGYGESEPAYRNDTEEGRRKNRRVVFRVIDR